MTEPRASAAELGMFLRSRRERLAPTDVGLEWGPRRRTNGLRRGEVAGLAGLSESWYTWLEQGRATPTVSVLNALCRVLRLTPEERRYVLSFANADVRERLQPEHGAATVELLALVQAVEPNPAYVLDENWDFLAWNRAYQDLIPKVADLDRAERNFLWLMFRWQPYRDQNVEWEREAKRVLGQYRSTCHLRPNDGRLRSIAEFLAESAEATKWWKEHIVNDYSSTVISFTAAGRPTRRFRHVKLETVDSHHIQVAIYIPI